MDAFAIFILATSRNFQQISSFDSRIKPIAETWGSVFVHTYMVFGTNVFDATYLTSNCQLKVSHGDSSSSSSRRRRLYASAPQTESVNRTDLYYCQQGLIKVLHVGNCTGEYFGMGPTCRCQEAMRYFMFNQQRPLFADVKWFAFMDDDLYIRPYSLAAMTQRMETHQLFRRHFLSDSSSMSISGSKGAVLVSTSVSRGFGFTKRFGMFDEKKQPNLNHTCRQHKFPICMPAIIHVSTMKSLSPAVSSNALTNLQTLWGGTHDALLGLLLWQYDIPVYSMSCCYKETKMTVERLNALTNPKVNRGPNVGIPREVFIVHRVKNMRSGKKGEHAVPSQHDMARYFSDVYNSSQPLHSTRKEQEEIGAVSVDRLIHMPVSTVGKTVFAPHAKKLTETYKIFYHTDCKLK